MQLMQACDLPLRRRRSPLDGKGDHLEHPGIRQQRFHDMRHAAPSLMLEQGMPARLVMETLSHSQIALTMNTYSHASSAMPREVATAIQRALG